MRFLTVVNASGFNGALCMHFGRPSQKWGNNIDTWFSSILKRGKYLCLKRSEIDVFQSVKEH